MLRYRIPFLVALSLLFSGTASAQESASSLATRIENLFASAGDVMTFTMQGQGKITLVVARTNTGGRLETPTMVILSNGKTIWNYDKKADRVTVDELKANSIFEHPVQLFQFAHNYTPQIVSSKGQQYVLQLTPNNDIASVLKDVGEMRQLELTVLASKKNVKILKAKAVSSKGESFVNALTIKPLDEKQLSKYNFSFKAGPHTKVVDLRE
jgi:outer membrane lipoprotein-sorting protein